MKRAYRSAMTAALICILSISGCGRKSNIHTDSYQYLFRVLSNDPLPSGDIIRRSIPLSIKD